MDTKVTVKLDDSDMEYLQRIADDRAKTKDPDYYERYFHEDYRSERACCLMFQLIDAAIEQGHIKPSELSVVERLWRNLEELIPIENKRNRKIAAKFREFEWRQIKDEELFAFTAKHPSVFKMLSEMLEQKGVQDIFFEPSEGHPFIKFFRADREIYMMSFSDEELETLLSVTTELIDLITEQTKKAEEDQKAHREYQRRAEKILGGESA